MQINNQINWKKLWIAKIDYYIDHDNNIGTDHVLATKESMLTYMFTNGYNIYLDDLFTKNITTKTNKITIPTRTGYSFKSSIH